MFKTKNKTKTGRGSIVCRVPLAAFFSPLEGSRREPSVDPLDGLSRSSSELRAREEAAVCEQEGDGGAGQGEQKEK